MELKLCQGTGMEPMEKKDILEPMPINPTIFRAYNDREDDRGSLPAWLAAAGTRMCCTSP